ncbi:MAG: tetratricopeptide repeat protein [Nitrospirae bacterium]|nr:tetratricopeptide repeat protein [Nitrospirota bacterium]
MGKNISNNKLKAIGAFLLFFVFLVTADISASYQEIELFDEGYEYYLSYQPEKAVEVFRKFLKEFPDSSTKDAAMFWLGKSLMQIKSFDEARKTFSEVRQQFSQSPFSPQIDRELQTIAIMDDVSKTQSEIKDAEKAKNIIEEKITDIENKAQIREKDLSKAVEEREKIKALLDEEKKRKEAMQAKIEGKEAELKHLGEEVKAKAALEEKLAEVEHKVTASEQELIKTTEDTEKLRLQLEEERKKTETMKTKISELEKKESELKKLGDAWEGKIPVERTHVETVVKKTIELEVKSPEPAKEKDIQDIKDGLLTVKGRLIRIHEEDNTIIVKDGRGKIIAIFFENEYLFSKIERLGISKGDMIIIKYIIKGDRNIGKYIRSLSFC